ncbi:MAG: protein kinase, partial [Planctomycetota bacterium]
EQGKIPWEEAILLVLDAAHGLEYAEKKGIVHRDIKPDNLMMDADRRAKIADLGLAKRERAHKADQKGVIGTPHFISPEQALGKQVDHRSDLYSLGATFFRMITGKNLFSGKTAKEIVLRHVQEAPPAASSLMDEIPDELDLALAKMLAKSPDDRYGSAPELIKALEEICAQHGIKGAVIRKGVPKRVLIPLIILLAGAIGTAVHFITKDPVLDIRWDPEAQRVADRERKKREKAEADRARAEARESARADYGALTREEIRLAGAFSLDETFDDEPREAERERDWRNMAKRYREFADDPEHERLVPDTVADARKDADRIKTRLDKLKASTHDFRTQKNAKVEEIRSKAKVLRATADALIKERRYGRAYNAVRFGAEGEPESRDPFRTALQWEWQSPNFPDVKREAPVQPVQTAVAEARAALEHKAAQILLRMKEDWQQVQKEVDRLAGGSDESDWERAIAALEQVVELFPDDEGGAVQEITAVIKPAGARRGRLQQELDRRRERALASDRRLIFDAVRKHSTLNPEASFNYVQDLRYGLAISELDGLRAALKTARYRAWVEERIGLLRWMEWLFSKLREDVAATDPRGKDGPLLGLDLEVPAEDGTLRPGVLKKFDKRKQPQSLGDFNFKPKRGREEVYHFGAFPMDWVYERVLAVDGRPRWREVTPELRFALGAFCFETFQYDAARSHFDKLAQDPSFGTAARALAGRAFAEGRAFDEYTQLCEALDREPASAKLKEHLATLATFRKRHTGVAFLLQVLGAEEAARQEFLGQDPVPVPAVPSSQ